MKPQRRRRFSPSLLPLEHRRLPSASPTAIWIGQDGHDLAGGQTALAGNGVQDIHVALSGLPAAKSIASVDMTGYGGGEWVVNIGPYNMYNGVLVQPSGSTTADLYVDPYQTETGRQFTITLTYSDHTTAVLTLNGGNADPNLRMPAYAVAATWIGQDGTDLTGPNPGVGPDGYQDVHLKLSHLFPGTAIPTVSVTTAAGAGWEYGTNPTVRDNAEFKRSTADPTQGDLYFSPIGDLFGQTLTVSLAYADGKLDHTALVAGHTNPNLEIPGPSGVNVTWGTFHAQWLGQDGLNLTGQGDVHIALDSLPAGRTVVTGVLSDEAGIDWSYTRPGSGATAADPSAQQLGFRQGSDPTRADLGFPPARDESGATLTLVLGLDDGSYLATRIAGSTSDPGLRRPGIASTFAVAYPGDDLNDLANRFGTVRLVSGLYVMNQPLVLNHPVTITAAPGATVLFAQPSGSSTWTAAIKVMASHTTLNGFAVRFAGPVRWNTDVSYGPAVIGTADNYDPWNGDPRLDLTFSHLDVQAPPPSTSWEEAPHLFRMTNAASGSIVDNLMKGGVTEFFGGPWLVTGNTYLGTLPETYAYSAFGAHFTHDVTISDNLAQPTGPSGKTWRFLVMTQNGTGDVIRDNTSIGLGPMDSDTVANPNASEQILTESYRLHYEGIVASVSPDGFVVQIYPPQGGPARTGDVVSILSGPQAGQWRTIAQVLNPNSYLLDSPISPGKFAISIATGFVNETFEGNTIDARGSSTANDLVLAGNQYGLRVINNYFLGGNNAFQITAFPTEYPNIWGWSHVPTLGVTISGNTIQDTLQGGIIDVMHDTYIKSDAGRVYFSGRFNDNVGIWDAPYLATRATIAGLGPPVMATIGGPLSADPGELVLSQSGNQVQGPSSVVSSPTLVVVAGTINGVAQRNLGIVLPVVGAAPPFVLGATANANRQRVTGGVARASQPTAAGAVPRPTAMSGSASTASPIGVPGVTLSSSSQQGDVHAASIPAPPAAPTVRDPRRRPDPGPVNSLAHPLAPGRASLALVRKSLKAAI
jgi:hypothetical protein